MLAREEVLDFLEDFGLSAVLHTDNGTPFAGLPGGYSACEQVSSGVPTRLVSVTHAYGVQLVPARRGELAASDSCMSPRPATTKRRETADW